MIFAVSSSPFDGTVTLSGTVRSLWAKAEAIDEAQEVADVKEVVSALIVMRGESDHVVGEAVAAKLRRYVFFTIFDDADVEVNEGVAVLTGVRFAHQHEHSAMSAIRARFCRRTSSDNRNSRTSARKPPPFGCAPSRPLRSGMLAAQGRASTDEMWKIRYRREAFSDERHHDSAREL
jgi:hypothetical protein